MRRPGAPPGPGIDAAVAGLGPDDLVGHVRSPEGAPCLRPSPRAPAAPTSREGANGAPYNAQARQLRPDYAAGTSTASPASRYDISPGVAMQIARGERYRAAGGPITSRKPRNGDDWTATWIRVLAADFDDRQLADEFGTSPEMVKRIRCGINYAWLDEVLPKVWRTGRAGRHGRVGGVSEDRTRNGSVARSAARKPAGRAANLEVAPMPAVRRSP